MHVYASSDLRNTVKLIENCKLIYCINELDVNIYYSVYSLPIKLGIE